MRCAAAGSPIEPAWTGRPIMTSWRAPRRATSGPSGRWRAATRPARCALARRILGQRRAGRGDRAGRVPARLDQCAALAPARPRSAPGSIASSSISASTRSAARADLPLAAADDPADPAPDAGTRAGTARARPAARRRDRRAAGPPARRDRAHLSGRARQRRSRGRARHLGLRRRDPAGPRQAQSLRAALRRIDHRREP